MKQIISMLFVLCLTMFGVSAQTYKQVNDISYTSKTDGYAKDWNINGEHVTLAVKKQ